MGVFIIRTTVIFECSGIGPKMLFTCSSVVENSWKFVSNLRNWRDTTFISFFDFNLFVGHQIRLVRGSQNLKVKSGHLRKNLGRKIYFRWTSFFPCWHFFNSLYITVEFNFFKNVANFDTMSLVYQELTRSNKSCSRNDLVARQSVTVTDVQVIFFQSYWAAVKTKFLR